MSKPSTRDRILAAGLECLHAHGYAATGVQEITAAAGVPKGSFYNHFASKAAFGVAALDAYWQAAAPVLDLLREPDRPPRERLFRHFRAVQAGLATGGHQRGCLVGNFAIEAPSAGPEIRARVAEIHAEWAAALADCLRDGAATGGIRRDIAPEDLARLLLVAWQGAIQFGKVEPSPEAGFDAFFRGFDRLLAP